MMSKVSLAEERKANASPSTTLAEPARPVSAQLPGAGEEVQYPAALQIELDDAENSLFDPVCGGTGVHPCQLF